jgi:hypothetical protein
MIRLRVIAMALGAVLVVGCTQSKNNNKPPPSVLVSLEGADEFELLSLDPEYQTEKPKNGFHGWKILGRAKIEGSATRKKLIAALSKGASENDNTVAACFNPRHGIHTSRDGKATDLVICFECLQVEAYIDGKPNDGFLTSSSPQPVFDQALRDAGVPLAEKRR